MARIVRLSEAASIAIHALILIARAGAPVSSQMLAEETGNARNHVAKIMQQMVHHNYIKSTRGPGGGFTLRANPEELTLLEIYEAVEGPIEEEVPMPERQQTTGILAITQKMTALFKSHLQNHTLQNYL
ncbi:MAG: RrF2 family transcriptional regulator [Bacteroidota bacterium]